MKNTGNNQYARLAVFLFAFALYSGIQASTFNWAPQGDEPAFSLDIPSDWENDYVVKANGAIVFFRDSDAVIEVRTFVSDDDYEFENLVNLKAARLAANYTHVRLLYERESKYRKGLYTAVWQISHKGRKYIEKTAFLVEGEHVLALSCLSPASQYKRYKVLFDNAILSFSLETTEKVLDGILELKKLFIFNRPNALYKIEPPTNINIAVSPTTKKKRKKRTSTATTTTTTTKKKKKKSTSAPSATDSFLPPVK